MNHVENGEWAISGDGDDRSASLRCAVCQKTDVLRGAWDKAKPEYWQILPLGSIHERSLDAWTAAVCSRACAERWIVGYLDALFPEP